MKGYDNMDELNRITSFCVDHNKLMPGMYLSRVDGDIRTYDLRFVKPNTPPFLKPYAMHTIEHLFATFARNSEYKERVIYFGPMGCRTGFYFLTRNIPNGEVIKLIEDAFSFIADYEGEIPGVSKIECGNYLEHNLTGAKKEAAEMRDLLSGYTEDRLIYV